MKRIALPINTTELCSYGCGRQARFVNGSEKLMCVERHTKCPAIRKKTGNWDHRTAIISQESKANMLRGSKLTKNDCPSKARPQFIGRKFGASLHGHSKETKEKLSKIRTEYLKNLTDRSMFGRLTRSWLELTFEKYLRDNNITGWKTEQHFWNNETCKNYFPDFIFESKKLIIELDGTQHRKTVLQDSIRDDWFRRQGYRVVRIQHKEFKQRYFSGKGFLDLLVW